mgnify:FL=1
MKKFFNDLFSGSSETSSKRFAAIITLVNIIILAYIAALNSPNKSVPTYMWTGLIIIVGGGLGLTVIEKIFGKGGDTFG